jgi:hypothetical protein
MGIFAFIKGGNASKSTTTPKDDNQSNTNNSNVQITATDNPNITSSNLNDNILYPSPNLKPIESKINNDSINMDIDASRLPSDEEIDRLLAQYSDTSLAESSSQTISASSISHPVQDSNLSANDLKMTDQSVVNQSNNGDFNVVSDVSPTQSSTTNSITSPTNTNLSVNGILDFSSPLSQSNPDINTNLNFNPSKSNEITQPQDASSIPTGEIPMPNPITEVGEQLVEHPHIDNNIITQSPDAVTIRSSDGIVEVKNPADVSPDFFNHPAASTELSFKTADTSVPQNFDQLQSEQTISDVKIKQDSYTNPGLDTDKNLNNIDSDSLSTSASESPDIPVINNTNEIANVVSAPKSLKNIRSIALVGLNDSDNIFEDIAPEILKFIEKLPVQTEIILDSNKMVGEMLVKNVNPKTSITGVYLKPFFSNYSDVSEQYVSRLNYRVVLFSNYFEKLTHIIENSDLIVIPLTSGLVNLANVANFLALQYIYANQSKPVILFGIEWREFINSLNLNNEENASIRYADTAEDLIQSIVELDKSSYETVPTLTENQIDLRKKGDEVSFILN